MNRTIRIGLAIAGLGIFLLLLLWIVPAIFGALSSRGPAVATNTSGDNDNGITEVKTQTRGLRVVAREPIPPKSIITEDMLTTEEAPADAPADEFVSDPDAIVDYITRDIAIPEGQPIQKTDLLGHVSKVGVAGLLRAGERAIVIPLNQPTLHDLIKTGDYVDVIAAFESSEANTIVRGVRVLAVDVFAKEYPRVSVAQRSAYKAAPAGGDINVAPTPTPVPDPNAPPGQQAAPPPEPEPTAAAAPPAAAITLEVTPEEATRISLAQAANARIDYVLIPPEEILAAGSTSIAMVNGTPQPGSDISEIGIESIETAATTILPELAPYSAALKRKAENKGGNAGNNNGGNRVAQTNKGNGGGGGNNNGNGYVKEGYRPPPLGPVDGTGSIPPSPVPVPEVKPVPPPPPTYQVKIVPDGKEARYETVLKPSE